MVFDMLGYPINIGDTIAYAPAGRTTTNDHLSTGIVTKIIGNRVKTSKMQISRNSSTVINLKYLIPLDTVKQDNPELFI